MRLRHRTLIPPIPRLSSTPSASLISPSLFAWIYPFAIMIISLYLLKGPWLTLQKYSCQVSANTPCPMTVVQIIEPYLNHSMVTLPLGEIHDALNRASPEAASITLDVNLPHTLTIVLVPSLPWINFKTQNPGYYYANHIRRIYAQSISPMPNAPVVTLPANMIISLGDNLSEPVYKFIFDSLEDLAALDLTPISVIVNSAEDLHFTFSNGLVAILSSQIDLSRQVTALQLVFPTATMNSPLPIVDVRLDKPVIKPATDNGV
jgi:hypothetical protein